MKNKPNKCIESLTLVVTLLFLCAPASAHHGNSAYDEQARVPIKGTVTEFVWTNPHSQIYLDVKDKNGNIVHWGIETNSPGILTRAGWTRRSVKPGDEVTIILCPAKNGEPVAYIGSGDPGTKVIFSDGRELAKRKETTKSTRGTKGLILFVPLVLFVVSSFFVPVCGATARKAAAVS